jgi:hypothetical protein
MDGRDGMDPSPLPNRIPPGGGASVVSWSLLVMGLATFAPCVLVPEWCAYRDFRLCEQREQHSVGSWEKRVERERRLIEAMQTDPNVMARLAQRDLGFRAPDGKPVRVAVSNRVAPNDEPLAPVMVPLPNAVAKLRAWLPNLDYERVFCDEGTRVILIIMSVVAMGCAIWIPRRRNDRLPMTNYE